MKLFTVPVATPAASVEAQLQLSHRVCGQREGDDNNSITRRRDNDGGTDEMQPDIESQFGVRSEKHIFNRELTQFTAALIERSRSTVSLSTFNQQVTIQWACPAPSLDDDGIITARVERLIPAGATYAKNV